MKKNYFWIEKDSQGFNIIHFFDGTQLSVETEELAVKIAVELLKTKGTAGY